MLSDIENKISLNKKKNSFFRFYINTNTFSIDIIYDIKQELELENLFLIIKSYSLARENLIKGMYVIASNEDFYKNNIKPSFFRSISLNKINKISYFDFSLFYQEMIENDLEFYLNKYEFYGFKIIFMKESIIWETKNFYPKYPWEKNFKNQYILDNNILNNYNKLKKENFLLKKKIKYSLYRNDRKRK